MYQARSNLRWKILNCFHRKILPYLRINDAEAEKLKKSPVYSPADVF